MSADVARRCRQLAFCGLPVRPALARPTSQPTLHRWRPLVACSAQLPAKLPPENDAIICPGKFDAFHVGHLSLARGAAALGRPLLLSFGGMAETLGWAPRAPVVAPVERAGIMREWSAAVGRPVGYRVLPFGDVRGLSPREFVRLLVEDVGAAGIVCGRDWRFGFKAEGDVALLEEMAAEMDGFSVRVVDGVEVDGEQVSSTGVRAAIAAGDVSRARRLMGRAHRLIGFMEDDTANGTIVVEDVINQVPGDGTYQALVRVPGGNEPVRCFLKIRRPGGADPMRNLGEVDMRITQGSLVFCNGCEAYIDVEEKVA